MVDKIEKFLSKLSKKELAIVQELKDRLLKRDTVGLNIKRIKGVEGVYRVRKGSLRIIFTDDTTRIKILGISRRSEKTYRDF